MRLEKWMEASGLTQAETAKRLRLTQQAVSYYLRGMRTPGAKTMRRIIRMTGGHVQPNDWFLDALKRGKSCRGRSGGPS